MTKAGAKYNAVVAQGRRTVYGGRWPTARAAAIAHDRLLMHFKLDRPLNLPAESRKLGAASAQQLRREALRLDETMQQSPDSRYLGVSWSKSHQRWQASVNLDRRPVSLGEFDDPVEAARVRDRVVLYFQGRSQFKRVPLLNFPAASREPLSPEQARAIAVQSHAPGKSSRYRGVYMDHEKPGRPWVAKLEHVGTLGRYRNERDAAVARDRAVLHYLGASAAQNHPTLAARLGAADAATLRAEALRDFKSTTRSRFFGLAPTQAGRWCAFAHHDKQRHYLGVFDTEEEAAQAYDQAALRLKGDRLRLNFNPETGAELCGEWVRPGKKPRKQAGAP